MRARGVPTNNTRVRRLRVKAEKCRGFVMVVYLVFWNVIYFVDNLLFKFVFFFL